MFSILCVRQAGWNIYKQGHNDLWCTAIILASFWKKKCFINEYIFIQTNTRFFGGHNFCLFHTNQYPKYEVSNCHKGPKKSWGNYKPTRILHKSTKKVQFIKSNNSKRCFLKAFPRYLVRNQSTVQTVILNGWWY